MIQMRDGKQAARRMAKRWGFTRRDHQILIDTNCMRTLYLNLIRLCYLTPMIERILPVSLLLYNLWGRAGRVWVRRKLKAQAIPWKA
jgi:hypothetical protein